MAHVEIPLNNLRYRFRKLTWREEVGLSQTKDAEEDNRRHYLTAALTEVADNRNRILSIQSVEDASRILSTLPGSVLYRLWVLYRASLPKNQYFTTKGLYHAPEARAFERTVEETKANMEETGSAAFREAEKRFGAKEIAENKEVERKILADAKKRGVLRTATAE